MHPLASEAMHTTAALHGGTTIEIEVTGSGPSLLLPVNPVPVEGPQAAEMRRWGADPALGRSLIDGMADIARVVAFDYEGHVMAKPKPKTLTPANVVADFLAVADAASADQFACYGYSWLAMVGLQLPLHRSPDRPGDGRLPAACGALPRDAARHTAGYELATGARTPGGEDEWSSASLSPDQSRQFVTLDEHLEDFDDRAAKDRLSVPRRCFVGSKDEIRYGPTWGDVCVSLADPLLRRRAELEALGWQVEILDGLDHTQAMQASCVVPMLRRWLTTADPAPLPAGASSQPGRTGASVR
jgi:pimeloyl-ACP methyl ester carboxylesterase